MSAGIHKVSSTESGVRLVNFLAAHEACSLRKAKALLDARSVFVNGKRVWMAKHTLQNGDRVEVQTAGATRKEKRPPPTVLFESDAYVVVDKPAGVLSNGPNSAENLLRRNPAYSGIQAVHRLDKDTSGCLCLARHPDAFDHAVSWFREGRILKIYQALVLGRPDVAADTISRRMDGRTAVTHWKVISANDGAAHLQVRIDTGRTHQIRKHLSGIGHPILGDRNYFTGRMDDKRLRTVPRQMLHAAVFQAPLGGNGKVIRVTAALPEDYKKTLALFRLR